MRRQHTHIMDSNDYDDPKVEAQWLAKQRDMMQ